MTTLITAAKETIRTPDHIHPQRELSDDDIVLGLKMYESKLSRMQSRIAKQMNVMNKQKRRIDDLKYYLKHKGDDYEADDLQGEIALKAAEAIKELQFASLESLGRGTEHEEEGQRVSDGCHSTCQWM